ncbi:MAG: hypothetical protein ACJAU6_002242 [Alphaproteobacteria bacterium]|jgi:hypothetical protein
MAATGFSPLLLLDLKPQTKESPAHDLSAETRRKLAKN